MEDLARKGIGFFSEQNAQFDAFIEQADDGPYFIDVLRKVAAEIQRVQTDNINKRPDD